MSKRGNAAAMRKVMPDLIWQFTGTAGRDLILGRSSVHERRRYAVVAPSRAVAVQALAEARIAVSMSFMETLTPASPSSEDGTLALVDREETVFYRKFLDLAGTDWMPVVASPAGSSLFEFRKTGDGIFLVDLVDGTHLGTVQKFTATEWWAYPANSAGATQFTAGSRQAAAETLRDHHTAVTAGEIR